MFKEQKLRAACIGIYHIYGLFSNDFREGNAAINLDNLRGPAGRKQITKTYQLISDE